MDDSTQTNELLVEIRDLVREQTDLYKKLATESVAMQERAMKSQRIMRPVIFVLAILLITYLAQVVFFQF